MPRYDYKCNNCQHEFEVDKKISKFDTKESCPKCNSSDTKRQISKGTDFTLKGPNWVKNGGSY